jgi:hypothetical protein
MRHATLIAVLLIAVGCEPAPPPIEQYNGKTREEWVQVGNDPSGDHATAAAALGHFKSSDASASVLRTLMGDKDIQVKLTAAESYLTIGGKAADVVPCLRGVIADKQAWGHTARLARLIARSGPAANELRADLTRKQEEAPNSQFKRWQECLDAIKG